MLHARGEKGGDNVKMREERAGPPKIPTELWGRKKNNRSPRLGKECSGGGSSTPSRKGIRDHHGKGKRG